MMTLRCIFLTLLALPLHAAEPVTRKDLKLGLLGTFSSDGHSRLRLEPGVALLLAPGESMHPDLPATVAARWDGYIQIVTPGEYRFSINARNVEVKVELTFHGETKTVLDATAADTDRGIAGQPVRLDAGFHRFAAEVKLVPGQRRFELLWTGPGFLTEPIPYFFFGHRPGERGEQFDADLARDHGRLLFEELACARCHRPEKPLTERSGPDLTAIATRTYAGWLDAWLADPAKLRPHAAMPKMFTDDARGQAERHAVARYLLSLSPPLEVPKFPKVDGNYLRSLENGKKLFTTSGCATCHGDKLAGTMKLDEDEDPPPPPDPRDSIHGFGTATGPQAIYALGGIGSKTSAEHLARFLKDPLATNAHGRMPAMGLSDGEALDIARHLMRLTDESIDSRTKLSEPEWDAIRLADNWLDDKELADLAEQPAAEQWVGLGRRLFASKGCANCHSLEENGRRIPVVNFADLSELRDKTGAGCLSEQPEKIAYPLDDRQRAALQAFVQNPGGAAPSPIYQARAALKRFNCLNCHSMHGEGGLGNDLADVMKSLENAQNADDVTPPRLTGIGHKATTAWLRQVMVEGGRARPWMGLRMPQYGEANVGFLPRTLAACEGALTDVPVKHKLDPDEIEAGRTLTGKEGLGCVACHDMSGFPGGGTRGPDLAQTARRVREDWFIRWMHNPQRLVPGTRMPQNFTDGRSVSNLLNADANAQTKALWSYFSVGPNLPLPSGLEPPNRGMPLVVKDRVEVMRTFLPGGAGPKPVAVGFPGGISYAFDSHASRLAYAWEGNFLDVGPVWTGRGGNAATPLGPRFFTPPPGQPWHLGEEPNFQERAGDFAFGALVPFHAIHSGPMRVRSRGYALDDRGTPEWSYEVDDAAGSATAAIREITEPLKSGVAAGLQRRFKIDAGKLRGRGLWFHAADLAGPPRLRVPAGAVLPIDVKLGLPANAGMIVLPQRDGRALVFEVTESPRGVMWEFPEDDGVRAAAIRVPAFRTEPEFTIALRLWVLPRDDDALLPALDAKNP